MARSQRTSMASVRPRAAPSASSLAYGIARNDVAELCSKPRYRGIEPNMQAHKVFIEASLAHFNHALYGGDDELPQEVADEVIRQRRSSDAIVAEAERNFKPEMIPFVPTPRGRVRRLLRVHRLLSPQHKRAVDCTSDSESLAEASSDSGGSGGSTLRASDAPAGSTGASLRTSSDRIRSSRTLT